MCGINGVFYLARERTAREADVVAMRDAMVHRGPDGAGAYYDGPVGLGHRRLSIIDVAGGAQPLSNEDGTIWITFNGEIYNYRVLMKQLRSRGHTFRTASDTEVIVHLYEERGPACVEELNGIFAFAIWDARRRQLVLARDRLGVKPLHLYHENGVLWFASEIKAFLARPGLGVGAPRLGAIREYLTFRHVFGTRTLFAGVESLAPAHYLVADETGVRRQRYWSIHAAEAEGQDDRGWTSKVESLLTEAVRMQMVADVPLGTFCSGGIDSSLITALAAQATPASLNTYSIGYNLPEWDERHYSRMVADRYRTTRHEIEISGDDFARAFGRARAHNDEPLSHPSSIPLLLLSGLARETVKVVLSGEGSDEAFMGYPRHLLIAVHAFLDQLAPGAGEWLGRGLRWLPARRARLLGTTLRRSLSDAILLNSAFVQPEFGAQLVAPDLPDDGFEERESALAIAAGSDALGTLARFELASYLAIALDRLDRMSMAHSLEARVPFLDHRLVELALALPVRLKLAGRTNKVVVRRVARRHLPAPVIERRKVGFGVPVSVWLRSQAELRDMVRGLPTNRIVTDGIVRRAPVEALVNAHLSNTQNNAETLWLLVNLAAWYDDGRARQCAKVA